MIGKVYLTGAGPGDRKLLTIKAAEVLQKAEVVVYDRLADERLLELVPAAAECIYAGKRTGWHTLTQEEINQLLVEKAQEGKTVVRLKGGDPFVFGRGGEEALVLKQNGIPFEIIPGVTSAIAVPAYAGIPVTHRHIAASFAVITGHEAPDRENSAVNWEKLATAADTLVFLMGVRNLPEIAAKLIGNGRPADTPAAFVRQGTRPEQQTVVTTLGEAAAAMKKYNLKPPAIFIVGEVVRLRSELSWFENIAQKPLLGKTVLVTRAKGQAAALTERLEALGAQAQELPLIRIESPGDNYVALDRAIEQLKTYTWLIFTSVNGVEYFFRRLFAAGKDTRAVAAKVAAIGTVTAAALQKYGIVADLLPEKFQAEGILASLGEIVTAGDRILLPRAEKARAVLPDGLRALGAAVDVVSAYRTSPVADINSSGTTLLKQGNVDYVTFASPSAVDSFVKAFGEEMLRQVTAVCIGPVTAETCQRYGAEPQATAEEYTINGLVEALVKLALRENGNTNREAEQ